MTTHPSIIPRSGGGYAAIIGNRLAFTAATDLATGQGVLDLLEITADEPWNALVRRIARRISDSGYEHTAIAIAECQPIDVHLFVFGDVLVTATVDGADHEVSASQVSTWIDTTMPGALSALQMGNEMGEPSGRIHHGLCRAGGLELTWSDRPERADARPNSAPEERRPILEILVPNDDPPASGPTNSATDAAPKPSGPPAYTVAETLSTPDPAAFDQTQRVDPNTLRRLRKEASSVGNNDPTPKRDATAALEVTIEPSNAISDPTLPPDHPLPPMEPPVGDSPEFDPNATRSVTGAQMRQAVQAAKAAADPRRNSTAGAGGDPGFTKPILKGVRCGSGHLNSMQDRRCRTCGVQVDGSGSIDDDERPTLGVLTLDDGRSFPLDRPVVFGRELPAEYTIGGEDARLLEMNDAKNMVSRVHLEVHLVGWDIELIDKGSSNGTFTRSGDATGAKIRLRAEHPTPVPFGTTVHIGDRTFAITAGPSSTAG